MADYKEYVEAEYEAIEKTLTTLFFLQFVLGLITSLVFLLAAPHIANFIGEPHTRHYFSIISIEIFLVAIFSFFVCTADAFNDFRSPSNVQALRVLLLVLMIGFVKEDPII